MGCENYAQTLNGWTTNPNTPADVHLDATGLKYTLTVQTPRSYLINNLNWEITGDEFGVCTVVPVRLISFTARPESNHIKLQWESINEENFRGYIVQRSADATQWTDIGFVNAQNAGSRKTDYTFNDDLTLQGIGYYRLKMMDIDDSYEYSEIRKVEFSGNVSQLVKGVYHLVITSEKGNSTTKKIVRE